MVVVRVGPEMAGGVRSTLIVRLGNDELTVESALLLVVMDSSVPTLSTAW